MAESPVGSCLDSLESDAQCEDVIILPVVVKNDYKHGIGDNNSVEDSDIPDSVKVLDEIISEYEEDSLQPTINNTINNNNHINNAENQSEDDGYMSLSRKNMHQKNEQDNADNATTDSQSSDERKESGLRSAASPPPADLVQSTLPKIKPSSTKCSTTSYSSLPCCGVRTGDSKARMGSCNGERGGVLGIDISAVHKAVLRGEFSKLPVAEPILNEHPVTIYPGKSSPSKKDASSRGKRLISSVEKHKELCHILNPTTSQSSTSSTSNTSTSASSSNSGSVDLTTANLSTSDKKLAKQQTDLKSNNQQLPKKSNGIAWEIYFDNAKQKAKAKAVADEEAAILELQALNQQTTSNLCGKGTFIIRRTTRKIPKSSEVFTKAAAAANTTASEDSSDRIPVPKDYEDEQESNAVEAEAASADEADGAEYYGNAMAAAATTNKLQLQNYERGSLELPLEESRQSSLRSKNHNNEPKSSASPKVSKACSFAYNESLQHSDTETQTEHSSEAEQNDSSDSAAGSSSSYNETVFKSQKNQDYLDMRSSNATTPRTDLAPTLEEDEEQLSDLSYGNGPLKEIENNISALLRGDIAVARYPNGVAADEQQHHYQKRILEFRPGVHKSESAKEMKLSHTVFGPLPPSPPSSNPDLFDYDDLHPLPPLPPSPKALPMPPQAITKPKELPKPPYMKTTAVEVHAALSGEKHRPRRDNFAVTRHKSDELPQLPGQFPFDSLPPPPPAVPPHRGHMANNIKSLSIDSNYKRKSTKLLGYAGGGGGGGSGMTTPTSSNGGGGPTYDGTYSNRRIINYGTKRSLKQSPREEHRLQTSCSLPETPIFARGCDIPRTPYRRQNECNMSGSRTAPRSSTTTNINMGASIVGIAAGSAYGSSICRQRSINHALASNELLRMSGVPARGWYPKQRSMRPLSTENIDRVTSMRMWDGAGTLTGSENARKPLTLPPNITPSFLNKSPREALRRVASLLITKKKSSTEPRKQKNGKVDTLLLDVHNYEDMENIGTATRYSSKTEKERQRREQKQAVVNHSTNTEPKSLKKKGIFKTLWKKTKHFSLDHQ